VLNSKHEMLIDLIILMIGIASILRLVSYILAYLCLGVLVILVYLSIKVDNEMHRRLMELKEKCVRSI